MPRVRLLMITLLAALAAATASAGRVASSAPGCGVGSLQNYIDLGSAGCSVGELTYFNFGFASNADIPFPLSIFIPDYVPGNASGLTKIANADSILVTPPNNIAGAVQFTSTDFEVGFGDRLVYYFTYTVDPPPDILPGFDLEMFADSPVFPGSATIDAAVCAGGNLKLISLLLQPLKCREKSGVSNFREQPYYLHVEHSVTPNTISLNDEVEFDDPTNYVQVWMRMELNGGPLEGILDEEGNRIFGSSQIRGAGVDTNSVPEPGTWLLLGAGLGAIGLARRRRS